MKTNIQHSTFNLQRAMMLAALLCLAAIGLLATGCNTTTFTQTGKDGSAVSIKNTRWLWSSESYTCQFNTNGASLSANKSNTDGAGIAAIVQGAVQGAQLLKP